MNTTNGAPNKRSPIFYWVKVPVVVRLRDLHPLERALTGRTTSTAGSLAESCRDSLFDGFLSS